MAFERFLDENSSAPTRNKYDWDKYKEQIEHLRFVEDKTINEIAAIIGVPFSALTSYLYRDSQKVYMQEVKEGKRIVKKREKVNNKKKKNEEV